MAEVRPLVLRCPSCATNTVETPIDQKNLDFVVKCTSCGKKFGRWEQVQAAFASKAKH